MLMHQHTTLFGPDADLDSDRVGMIDPNCRMAGVIKNSYQQAAFLCEEYYQVSKALIGGRLRCKIFIICSTLQLLLISKMFT